MEGDPEGVPTGHNVQLKGQLGIVCDPVLNFECVPVTMRWCMGGFRDQHEGAAVVLIRTGFLSVRGG